MAALLYAAKQENCPFEVVLVASNKTDAAGLKLAEAEGVPTFACNSKGMSREDHDAIMDEALQDANAEYVALAGYMRILTDGFVQNWSERMVNIHPSLLPKYKGIDTHQRALEAGDSHCGCSVHLVTPELDDGPVLGQTEVAIMEGDTVDSLADRVLIAEHQLYANKLSDYIGRVKDPEWLLEQVRIRAMTLAEAEETTTHGAPAFKIAGKSGKFFATFSVQHHGESNISVLVKTSGEEEQTMLIDAEPDVYYRPKFYGAAGWIAIRLNAGPVDWDHVQDWLAKSWRQVAPKKLTKFMDIADEF